MWKSKRNVTITYKPLSSPPNIASKEKVEDVVEYQTLNSSSQKQILGIDTIGNSSGEWDWRGKGWLKIASSHWEVLGWGDLDGGGQWVLTYFAKTLFTTAGVDVYSRGKEGHSEAVVEEIKKALAGIEDESVKKLAGELFEVVRN